MNEVVVNLADINHLQELSQSILQEAHRLGASQAELGIAIDKGFSVSVREGDVETVEYHADKSIDVTVYFGKRSGTSGLSDLRPDALRAAVEAACHIAKFTDEDPASGLPEKNELGFNYPQLKMAYPWDVTVAQAIAMAIECEDEALSVDKRLMNAEPASVTTIESLHFYANSHGFVGFYPHTRHETTCVMIAKQGEEIQRDYSYTTAVDPSQLEAAKMIGRKAAERTIRRLGARRIATTKAPVLFLAEEAKTLLGHFMSAISGGSIYRKSSFLLDHVNQVIFPEFINIYEQPLLPRGLGSAPFDDEGVLTRPNVFVKDGRLNHYALGVYSARKLGLKTTGNAGGVHNLTISTGNKNFTELLKAMHTGLLVTEIMGNGVNMVTGDYSRGVGGYWVENGEIQFPVHEVTIAGNLKTMFANIAEVGNDVDMRSSFLTGSILLNEMVIAGD